MPPPTTRLAARTAARARAQQLRRWPLFGTWCLTMVCSSTIGATLNAVVWRLNAAPGTCPNMWEVRCNPLALMALQPLGWFASAITPVGWIAVGALIWSLVKRRREPLIVAGVMGLITGAFYASIVSAWMGI